MIDATRAINPRLTGITLERLQAEGTVPLHFDAGTFVPFADLRFPTASGKVELRCEAMEAYGEDPLPHYEPPAEFRDWNRGDGRLVLLSGAAHHYVSSSLANVPTPMRKEGVPVLEINPADAAARGIEDGADVVIENARGWCRLRARVTEDAPPGVAVSPKGPWPSHSPEGRNINWTTSDAVADVAGQSTFHSNLVFVRPVAPLATERREAALAATPSDD